MTETWDPLACLLYMAEVMFVESSQPAWNLPSTNRQSARMLPRQRVPAQVSIKYEGPCIRLDDSPLADDSMSRSREEIWSHETID